MLGGLATLILIAGIAGATGGGTSRQTGDASPVAAATLTHTATPSPAPTHHTTEKKTTRPQKTRVASQATTPAPAATAPAAVPSTPVAAPSTPVAATSAGCHPLSDEGTCYEPGEYCRDADHGASGIAGDGKAITCEDNDGWRWEPA